MHLVFAWALTRIRGGACFQVGGRTASEWDGRVVTGWSAGGRLSGREVVWQGRGLDFGCMVGDVLRFER